MTSSTIQPQANGSAATSAAAPKRRRRTPPTGAAEDCHTCRKSHTPCDRRRPYCSQCIEGGKDCSGYRTNLTWGVGVASRGKLRGLSLPIVTTADNKPQLSPATESKAAATQGEDILRSRKRQRDLKKTDEHTTQPAPPRLNASPDTRPNSLRQHHFEKHIVSQVIHELPQNSPQYTSGYQYITTLPYTPVYHDYITLPTDLSQPEHVVQASWEAFSNDSYADILPSGDDFYPSQQNSIKSQIPSAGVQQDPVLPLDPSQSSPAASSSFFYNYHADHIDTMEGGIDLGTRSDHDCENDVLTVPNPTYWPDSDRMSYPTHSNVGFEEQALFFRKSISPMPLLSRSLQTSTASPRMRSLLEYYDKAICPVLVAFDGPSNPYRKYVLPLALHDKGLQNALSALVTNNIRMRRLDGIPAAKNFHNNSSSAFMLSVVGRPTDEEQAFKGKSIELLNQALAKPNAPQDDALLATLLILCLFHVCDSGFSKFKTQLAGVQKLLSMRGKRSQSDLVNWVEMFFAWFDVMTSAVNDRETQMDSDSLKLVNLSDNLGALEQFSGCDGRLFKLIARLGRLNLLSQRREVRVIPFADRSWISQDRMLTGHQLSDMFPDDRHDFWYEWHDIRQRLFNWQLSPYQNPSTYGAASANSQHDICHISESFRYSALLYTERLAFPTLSSSSPNIQNYVLQAMHHISQIGINSCVLKFMLWPLFITGTECVVEEHRDQIRMFCAEIQKESGFYNNFSSLEVLERVWNDGDGSGSVLQAFRWRDAMPRIDGEYIVI